MKIRKRSASKSENKGSRKNSPWERQEEGRHEEGPMLIDMRPVVYGTLTIYVVGGILCAVLLSLGAWGLTTGLKRLHEREPRDIAAGEGDQVLSPFTSARIGLTQRT
jgi:hypothetical protein